MKKVAFAVIAVFALGSCNTMIGMGRDFRQLGEGMENKAHGRAFDGSESHQNQDNLPTY
jgi:predicted small secreted protein